jgi:hypothetical protein
MSLGHGASIVRDGLVLHLDAANPKSYTSGTTWFDLSGNNNGTLVNGVGYSTDNKGAMVFDGSNDRIMLSRISPQGESLNWTTNSWVKYNSTGYTSWMIVIDQANYNLAKNYMMWLSSDSPGNGKLLATYDGNWQYGTIRMLPNVWYNITLTRVTNTVKFYINGNFDVQRTFNNNISSNANGDIGIGGHTSNSGYPFNGFISNARIYNRALTTAEIKQNFEATRGRYGI